MESAADFLDEMDARGNSTVYFDLTQRYAQTSTTSAPMHDESLDGDMKSSMRNGSAPYVPKTQWLRNCHSPGWFSGAVNWMKVKWNGSSASQSTASEGPYSGLTDNDRFTTFYMRPGAENGRSDQGTATGSQRELEPPFLTHDNPSPQTTSSQHPPHAEPDDNADKADTVD